MCWDCSYPCLFPTLVRCVWSMPCSAVFLTKLAGSTVGWFPPWKWSANADPTSLGLPGSTPLWVATHLIHAVDEIVFRFYLWWFIILPTLSENNDDWSWLRWGPALPRLTRDVYFEVCSMFNPFSLPVADAAQTSRAERSAEDRTVHGHVAAVRCPALSTLVESMPISFGCACQ